MAASKKPTHVVTHDGLYLAIGGPLKLYPRGTTLTLTGKQGEKMVEKGMIAPLAEEKE